MVGWCAAPTARVAPLDPSIPPGPCRCLSRRCSARSSSASHTITTPAARQTTSASATPMSTARPSSSACAALRCRSSRCVRPTWRVRAGRALRAGALPAAGAQWAGRLANGAPAPAIYTLPLRSGSCKRARLPLPGVQTPGGLGPCAGQKGRQQQHGGVAQRPGLPQPGVCGQHGPRLCGGLLAWPQQASVHVPSTHSGGR